MKRFPAIALIELSNIASGIRVGDAMVKKAPIAMLKSGTISRGKYLILIGGSVASVDESYHEGLRVSGPDCLDSLILPDVHPMVFDAVLGVRSEISAESVSILETPTVSTTILAADAAVKGSNVHILEMRLGDGYGGKGYTLFNGKIEDVQTAIDISCEIAREKNVSASVSVIPLIHEAMMENIHSSLRFGQSNPIHLSDGEQDVTG